MNGTPEVTLTAERTLTAGWEPMKLRDVCELINGRAYKQPELLAYGKYRVLRVGNFFTNDHWYYSDLELEERKYCQNGDLLYAWSASFGPRIWSGGKVIFHYHIWKVVPDRALIDKKFLYMFFLWDKELIKQDQGTGTTMIHVSKTSMEDRDILVPPLAEQDLIVAKLDTLLARSKTARDELSRVPRLIERYKQAILEESMRADDGREWPLVPLENLVTDGPTNGYSPRVGENPNGTLSLKLTATTRGVFDLSDRGVKRLNEIIPASSKFWLRQGDILIQRANSLEYVGVAAIYEGPENTYIYPDLMMRVRVPAPTLGRWIWRYLGSTAARNYFISNATGTAGNMPKINGSTVRQILIPLPPADKLAVCLERLDRKLTEVDRVNTEVANATALLDRLSQAVLDKAFRGKLLRVVSNKS